MATPWNEEQLPKGYSRNQYGNIVKSGVASNTGLAEGLTGANSWQTSLNNLFDTNYGNTQYQYQTPEGSWTSADLSGNKEALDYFNNRDAYDSGAMQYGDSTGTNWAGIGGLVLGGLDVAGKLWQGKTAAEGLKLAKDKFNFEKGLAAANYANQAKSYNEELGRMADVGLALGGNAVSPEQRAATLASVAANKVNTTL